MARKKISQLESAVDVTANDLIQVIDVEDGDMAPSGTNKKATAQLLANELGKLTNVTATGSTASRSLANRFAGVVNVKDFGAIGDGVADDTTAIQAAIDAIPATPEFTGCGGSLLLPKGNYKISQNITINKNISIIGDGASIIGNVSLSTKKCAFYIGDPAYIGTNNGWFKVYIEGLRFELSGNERCVDVQGIRTIKINKCIFRGGSEETIRTQECWAASSIENCQFWGDLSGSTKKAILLTENSNGFLICNNRIGNYGSINGLAIFVRDSSGVWIQNNDLEYNYAQITFYPTVANGCNNAHIENNWIEGATSHSIRIDNEIHGFRGATIRGNSIYGTPDGGVYLGVGGGTGEVNGVIVDGNTFNSPAQFYRGSISTKYINVSSKNNFPDSSNIKCPAFKCVKTTTQTIPSAAWTKITWSSESFDRGGYFSGSLWSPATSQNSLVRLKASIGFSAGITAGDYLSVGIYKNGSLLSQSSTSAQSSTHGTISVDCIDINNGTTDVYEAFAYASNGGVINNLNEITWFEGVVFDF